MSGASISNNKKNKDNRNFGNNKNNENAGITNTDKHNKETMVGNSQDVVNMNGVHISNGWDAGGKGGAYDSNAQNVVI